MNYATPGTRVCCVTAHSDAVAQPNLFTTPQKPKGKRENNLASKRGSFPISE